VTDRYDEANSHFYKFCERAKKKNGESQYPFVYEKKIEYGNR